MTPDLARYLGRPYDAGAADCADLVADVLREEMGIDVDLPGRAASARARDRQARSVLAEAAAPAADPRPGDVALLRPAGRRAGAHHVGVVGVDCAGRAWALHAQPGVGAVLTPLDELPRRGYALEGLYRAAP